MNVRDLPSLVSVAWLATTACFASVLPAESQETGKRIALLIANDHYSDENDPSTSGSRDAAALSDELRRDAFETDIRRDLGQPAMRDAVATFLAKLKQGSVGLFYYNGIGIQVAHQTYLVPVNVEIWSEADVKKVGINVDALVADMHRRGAAAQIVILDASRSNPYERRFREYSAGLAGIDAPIESLILYATAPNKLGKKATGPISVFMDELVKELRTPGISAEQAFTHVRVGVARASKGEQIPSDSSTLIHMFSFGQDVPTIDGDTPLPARSSNTVQPVALPPSSDATAPTKVDPSAAASAGATASAQTNAGRQQTSALESGTPARDSSPARVPGAIFVDCAGCPEMKVLPPGNFQMGTGATPFDKPVHHVVIGKPFAIGLTEVTSAAWHVCVTEGGCQKLPETASQGDDRPVTNVSWFDAKEYVVWLRKKTGKAYRLPSEAEWEYAAHGGTTTPFYWGANVGDNMANCADCNVNRGTRQTSPVKSYPVNKFELYDMAGNAAEWVEDCWNSSYRGAPRDGTSWVTGSCQQRVLRGGSFDSTASYVKPSARFRYDADVRYYGNGFRVVRDIP